MWDKLECNKKKRVEVFKTGSVRPCGVLFRH